MLHRLGRFVKSILGQTFTQLHRFIETGLLDEVVGKLSLKTMFQLSMNNDEFGKDKVDCPGHKAAFINIVSKHPSRLSPSVYRLYSAFLSGRVEGYLGTP